MPARHLPQPGISRHSVPHPSCDLTPEAKLSVEKDAANLLYRYGIGSVLVSFFAASGLAFISAGQISRDWLTFWWLAMTAVLALRGLDIFFYRFRMSASRQGTQEIFRFGIGLVAAALLWALFPLAFLAQLNQSGRAYVVIVLCGMVGGSATVLAPSKTLSLLFCALLTLPAAVRFAFLPGIANTFVGVLGCCFFAVMLVSSRVANRATMTALRLRYTNQALLVGMQQANTELKETQEELRESNQSLEVRIRARTADLQAEAEQKEHYAKELAHLASTDSLTGLSNRVTFAQKLAGSLQSAAANSQSIAVLFVDLDKFKEVNDLMGHSIGDQVLQAVAKRLVRHAPSAVQIARWGGDEFVMAIAPVASTSEAIDAAQILVSSFRDPIETELGVAMIDATIGIALFPQDGRTADELIRAADMAMYAGKEEKRSKIKVFSQALSQRLTERHRLEDALRKAIHGEALSIVFQPIIGSSDGRCQCLEVLARWSHPERGAISAAEFIPIAERTGEISALGRWVLTRACREAAAWPGLWAPAISVNVSAIQMESGTLAREIFRILKDTGLPPTRLQIELTESVFAGDRRNIIPNLFKLREKGIKVSLDDFGTGFSCLADLRRLPIDQIKIDKSFVESLDIDSKPIVEVILTTAHTLGLKVVAEGVETEGQAECLIGLGADYLQGYFFSNVLSPEKTREWLAVHAAAAVRETRPGVSIQ